MIATSSAKTNFIKESRNYIPFIKAMRVVAEESFNVPSPCPFDPMLLHFRIKTESKRTMNEMHDILVKHFNSGTIFNNRLLDKKYGKSKDRSWKRQLIYSASAKDEKQHWKKNVERLMVVSPRLLI